MIRVYDVVDNGAKLADGRPFLTTEPGGTPDGFRLDADGNLWCGWGMGNEKQDGVKIFDPTGKPIGFIALPERCANVCFGGIKRNRLFMTASHSLYSLYVNTQGAPGGSRTHGAGLNRQCSRAASSSGAVEGRLAITGIVPDLSHPE